MWGVGTTKSLPSCPPLISFRYALCAFVRSYPSLSSLPLDCLPCAPFTFVPSCSVPACDEAFPLSQEPTCDVVCVCGCGWHAVFIEVHHVGGDTKHQDTSIRPSAAVRVGCPVVYSTARSPHLVIFGCEIWIYVTAWAWQAKSSPGGLPNRKASVKESINVPDHLSGGLGASVYMKNGDRESDLHIARMPRVTKVLHPNDACIGQCWASRTPRCNAKNTKTKRRKTASVHRVVQVEKMYAKAVSIRVDRIKTGFE